MRKVKNILYAVVAIILLSGAVTMIAKIGIRGSGGAGISQPSETDQVMSLEELKSKYEFTYYSDFLALKTDLDGSTTSAAGSQQENEDSNCAVYYDPVNERSAVVLLNDMTITEPYTFDMPVEINFAGKTLSCSGTGLQFKDSAYINGRLGGGIVSSGSGDLGVLLSFDGGTVRIAGGSYIVDTDETSVDTGVIRFNQTVASGLIQNAEVSFNYGGSSGDERKCAVFSESPLIMENVDVQAKSKQNFYNYFYGVLVMADTSISNCRITCEPGSACLDVAGIYSEAGTLCLMNNTVSAYTPSIFPGQTGEYSRAFAVCICDSAERLIINGGDYFGGNYSVYTFVSSCINGGRYTTDSGCALYFLGGEHYVQNATIGRFYMAMYGDCSDVYMDSCTFFGTGGLSGYIGYVGRGNLYVSNTDIPDGLKLAVEGGGVCIAGENTNFTTENVFSDFYGTLVTEDQLRYTSFRYTYENREQYLNP